MKKKNYLSFWVFFMGILGICLVSPSTCLSQSVKEWELKSSSLTISGFQTVAHSGSTVGRSSIVRDVNNVRSLALSFYKGNTLVNSYAIDSPFAFNQTCCDYVAPTLVGHANSFAYFYSKILSDKKSSRIYLSTFSQEGALKKTINIDVLLPAGYYDYLYQGILGADGDGYYLLLQVMNPNKTHYAYLMRFDSDLALKSTKSFPSYSDNGNGGYALGIKRTSDGGFILVYDKGTIKDYVFVRLTTDNTIIWQKDFTFALPSGGTYSQSLRDYGARLFEHGNVCGVFFAANASPPGIYSTSFNMATGDILGNKKLNTPVGINFVDIKSIDDSLFVGVGWKYVTALTSHLVVFSLDKVLSIEDIADSSVRISGVDIFNGQLVLAGEYEDWSGQYPEYKDLLMGYSNSYLSSDPSGLREIQQNTIAVYPNPIAHGSALHIEGISFSDGTRVSLSDMSGKEVLLSTSGFIVAPDLPGMYIIRIDDGTQRQIFKKLFVQ